MAGSRVTGFDALHHTLEAGADDLADLDTEHAAAGRYLADRVRSKAPRDTGRLASTVASTVVAGTASVTVDAPYAVFVHAANPWAVRELAAAESHLLDLYAAGVDHALAR